MTPETPLGHRPGKSDALALPRLASSTIWNGIAQIISPAVALLLTPVFVSRLGLTRFGIWAMVLTVLTLTTSLDGGIGASLTRFFAAARADFNPGATTRLAVTGFIASAAVGLAASAALFLGAPTIVRLLSVPAELRGDGIDALRWVGPLTTLALISNVPAALLQARERFKALALLSSASSLLYAVTALSLTRGTNPLQGLITATLIRFGVAGVLGWALAFQHARGKLRLVSSTEGRAIRSFAVRMQLSSLLALANSQADALVIALFLPIRDLGLFNIGFQAAWAVRSVALWAVPPIATRIAAAFGERGQSGALDEFARLNAAWQQTMVSFVFVAAPALLVAVPAWVGVEYRQAGIVAVLLAGAYAVNLTTAIGTAYLRAIAAPGVEAQYALVSVGVNIALTVPIAIAFGLFGVVVATVVGTVVGTLALPHLATRKGIGELAGIFSTVRVRRLTVAAVFTAVVELGLSRVMPPGILGIIAAGIPAAIGLAIATHPIRKLGEAFSA